MPADARINQTSVDEAGDFNARSMEMTRNAQIKDYGPDYVDPNQMRKPEYFVYIYSVVDQRPADYKLRRSFPPLVPEMEIAELGDPKKILRTDKGFEYVMVTKLGHPMMQPCMKENGDRYVEYHDARRVAMDIVNPENLTLDQDRKITGVARSEGNDYGKLGVFWSLNNPPTNEEVQKAIRRKESHYRSRLDQARIIEASNPKSLDAYITPTDHVAADYFGEQHSWHQKRVKKETCPNCGEDINPGAKFHTSQALGGILCILDWRAAVNAGVKKLKDVPEDMRWDESSRTGEAAAS